MRYNYGLGLLFMKIIKELLQRFNKSLRLRIISLDLKICQIRLSYTFKKMPRESQAPSHSHDFERTDVQSEEEPLTDQSQEEHPNRSSASSSKRKRGPTRCKKTWGRQGPPEPVEFNQIGQPDSENTNPFESFLGNIARTGEKCPISYRDWRRVPLDKKEDMWAIVKTKYDVPEDNKPYVIADLGKKWREWKSTLRTKYFLENEPPPPGSVIPSEYQILCDF
ncbi:uncharacterized protein LOC143855088 isoform X2 [Tasmannia lanceolata]|uniref:uncharacterized protein LOC143855088 isoform X2 n=1 Tax=Tasmannia lanceolata TaxID=3420 RepID=UPI004063B858